LHDICQKQVELVEYIQDLKKANKTQENLIENQNIMIKFDEDIHILDKYISEINRVSTFHENHQDTKLNDGFVYIARQTNESNVYKIGITTNISQRERSFSTGNAFVKIIASKKTENPQKLEYFLHKLFRECRISGEWFKLTDDDISDLIREFGFCLAVE
jgi:predicted GIY-YIG superfamily endonuclease